MVDAVLLAVAADAATAVTITASATNGISFRLRIALPIPCPPLSHCGSTSNLDRADELDESPTGGSMPCCLGPPFRRWARRARTRPACGRSGHGGARRRD